MVEAKQVPEITKEDLLEKHATVDDDKNSVEVWRDFFVTKRENLITFLKTAIDKNLPIRASI